MKEKIPKALKSAAALMAADIMLLAGFVFLLLGASKFLNEFIGIEGSGEGIVGIVLLVFGLIILLRSKMAITFRAVPAGPPQGAPPQPPPTEAPSDPYR